MTVQEIMERVNSDKTGLILAYIKDGLEEMNMEAETHVQSERFNISEDTRFYDFPFDLVKVIDIRVLNHENSDDKYRSVPRSIYDPMVKDEDGY